MLLRNPIVALAFAVIVALPAVAQNTIYSHDFDGPAGTPLHGVAPDMNNSGMANTWVTRTDTGDVTGTGQLFFADGTINGSSGGANGSATLAFTPTPGAIYTLSASFDSVTSTANNWVALGFTAGQSSTGANNEGRFISGATAGQPWMLYRGSGALQADQAFLGPGTANGVNWTTPATSSPGAPADLRIILDTTNPVWSAEWQARDAGAPTYTTVRSEVYATNPTIGGVGIAIANTDIMTTINSFRLETNSSILMPGDVNGDGQVNINDFNVISDNLFNTGATRAQGDLDGNTIVDFVDFRLWKSLAGGAAAGVSLGVPEPATWLLGSMALLWVSLKRRR